MPSAATKDIKELFKEFEVTTSGLSSAQAQSRLKVYGPNKVREEKRTPAIMVFLSQFKSPLVWILIGAMGISVAVQEYIDVAVIGVIVLINAVLGFVQEYRAERAIDALKSMVSLKATVLRDGKQVQISAEDIVPGDILVLAAGDKVAADARLIDAVNLRTQEAALTGESAPVAKKTTVLKSEVQVGDQANMVFSGTTVVNGHAQALVVATGMQTEFGKIARLIQEATPEPTPLQKKLKKLSAVLGVMVVAIAILVFVVGISVLDEPVTAILMTAIALAVAAIPEGLPAVVTVGLSLGVQRLAKKNALIRNLPSVETLGACTVICSDKTGTLTHNEMTVRKLFVNRKVVEVSGAGYASEGEFSADTKSFDLLLKIGALNNNVAVRKEKGWVVIGDPTEAALLVAARKAGIDDEQLKKEYERVKEIEFTSERKRMTTVHKFKSSFVSFMKGAPEVVLDHCSKILVNGKVERLSRQEKEKILEQNDAFAKNALRVMACAYKQMATKEDSESDLVFVGLQGMIDPPRKEAKDAVQKCKSAGIKVIMITGDHITTAKAVAKELGIEGRAITGVELDAMAHFEEQVESIAIYARVNPAHKLRIVEALQKHGHIVAMTGDGVNDAPALKKADLGIAMGITGTDVAKEASPMILADDNFATIVKAVEEGRRIYDNIQKYLAYLLSGNIGEVLVILTSILLGMPLPLIAIQILWINLVTDGLPALALGVDPAEPGVMQRKPRKPSQSVFAGIEPYVYIYPIILTIGTLWLFDSSLPGDVVKAQTLAFTSIVVFELFQALSCHSISRPIIFAKPFSNKWLWLAVGASFVLQASLMYIPALREIFNLVPLSIAEWALVCSVSIFGFLYLEIHKFIARA